MAIKIITAPTAPVIPLADLRLHLRMTVIGSTHPDDDLVLNLLLAAHKYAEHYTGTAIGSQTLELALDEFPDGAIELTRGPATGITSVTYIDTAGDSQTVDSANYTLDDYALPQWVVPAYGTTWPSTLDTANAVKVSYVAGNMPDAVRAALLIEVAAQYPGNSYSTSERESMERARDSLLNTVKVWGF